ncbi:hypothetical protein MMC11_002309 [Xylographa trunciseda]|nr:hypothetical protein [Xylographa trunciseda]
MSGSPSRATQHDTKLPGMPASNRHVQATNAWAQEQAMKGEDNSNMENVRSLARPYEASTGGVSGDNGHTSFALSHHQNNQSIAASRYEKASQATLVREKNSWAQQALNINDIGGLLQEINHDQYTTSARARARVDPVHNDEEEMGLAIVMPTIRRAAVTLFPSNKKNKTRSVGEPTSSNPFSMTRKMSLKGLRNVLTGTKALLDDSSAGKVPENAPPVPYLRSDKASRVLGLNVLPGWQSEDFVQPPESAPLLQVSNSYQDHTFEPEDPVAFGRKAMSTSILTEDIMPVSPMKAKNPSRLPAKGEVESEGIVLGHGNLSPTKSGSYGTMGRLEVVGNNFARVTSQQGIIETMDDGTEGTAHEIQSPAGQPSATLYSPSMYEGVWENHPNVQGRSLQPFSPGGVYPVHEYRQLVDEKLGTSASETSSTSEGSDLAMTSSVDFEAKLLASSGSDSSGSSSSADSAEVVSLFESDADKNPVAIAHDNTRPNGNAAPAPPESYPGYQASVAVDFKHAMMALHHHIETSNDRLQRLVEDKCNRIHDELVRRCESLEEKIQKNGKGASKHDLNGLKNEFDILGHDLHVTATTGTETKRLIHTMLAKVAALDRLVQEKACRCELPQPQRLADQEGATAPHNSTVFFNSHGAPNFVSSHGYLHVPLQHNGNQFAPFGNSNTYANFGTPQFRTEASTNFGPRPREVAEDYYRASGNPQMMRVIIPEMELRDDLTFLGKDQHCSIPFGIKGPNDVLYELPSFMRMTTKGPVIIDESPVSTATDGSGGVDVTGDNENLNQPGSSSTTPFCVDGPYGIQYDLPSFMSYDAKGNIVLDQFDENGHSIAVSHALGDEGPNVPTDELPSYRSSKENSGAVVEDKDIAMEVNDVVTTAVGAVPIGIKIPNGVVYELPSFLRLNGDGEVEVVKIQDSDAGQGDTAITQTDRVPIGIRMDNGIVYELPSFMHINDEGQAEVRIEEEPIADVRDKEGLPAGIVPVGIRGPNRLIFGNASIGINNDGQEVVIQEQEGAAICRDSAGISVTDGVPLGVRMNNGIVYEVPSFMNITEGGSLEVNEYDVFGRAITSASELETTEYPAWSEGPDGVWFNESATMEDIFGFVD